MRKFLVTGGTDNSAVQFFRYFFAGGLAFVVDFGLLFLLTEVVGLHYLVSAVLSFSVGVTVNYVLSILWVFNHRAVKNPVAEFSVFTLLAVAGLAANVGLMYSLTELVGLHYLLSKVGSTGLTFVGNFVAKKVVLFPSPGEGGSGESDAAPAAVRPDVSLAESV